MSGRGGERHPLAAGGLHCRRVQDGVAVDLVQDCDQELLVQLQGGVKIGEKIGEKRDAEIIRSGFRLLPGR